MHNYDFGRHERRYDVGGWAWANTELTPDMLLWYSFLRTGRPDLFRMAEAMTRQTSEVEVYHIGPVRAPGLATQREPLGRRREAAADQPLRAEADRRFPYHRRAGRRPHARALTAGLTYEVLKNTTAPTMSRRRTAARA